jgi:hypothetical protein
MRLGPPSYVSPRSRADPRPALAESFSAGSDGSPLCVLAVERWNEVEA